MPKKGRAETLRARAVAPTQAPRPKTLHAVLLLAVLASLAYGNSLQNGFVLDDQMLITQNWEIRNLSELPRVFTRESRRSVPLPSDRGVTHRPVRTAVLAVEYYFFGRHPAGYRTVNILLHILNGALVFMLLRTLLGRPWPALFAAALFIVHPIQTEAVAYIAGQRDVLFTTFYLLGVLSFVRYRATDRLGYLALAGLAYLFSLFTKEMAITLPLLWVGYDLLRALPGAGPAVAPPLGHALREGLRVVLQRHKWLYLSMAAALALLLLYFVFVANPSHQRALYGGGLGPTLATSARIVVHYLEILVFPMTLNADSYGAFPVSRSLADPQGLLAFLVLGALGYGLFRLLRVDRWATFGGLWFFVALLPVSQLIPHQELVAEHFLYLPSVGFCLVIALLIERGLAIPRAATTVAAAFGLVLLLFGIRTVLRNRDWKDELTLWTKTVQAAPRSYWAHQRLGDAYKSRGRYEEAVREYKVVQALTPGHAAEFIAIGDSYRRLGQHDEAANEFSRALEVSPNSVAARLGLAQTYVAMDRLDRAREEYVRVSRFVLRAAQDFRATGDAEMAEGRPTEAVQSYLSGLEFNPFDPALQIGLGKAYEALGRYEEAAATYRRALQLDPASTPAKGHLDELRRTATPVGPPSR